MTDASEERCENCKKWFRINNFKGYCEDDMNWYDTTYEDSWCENWKDHSDKE